MAPAHVILATRRREGDATTLGYAIGRGAVKVAGSKRASGEVFRLL